MLLGTALIETCLGPPEEAGSLTRHPQVHAAEGPALIPDENT